MARKRAAVKVALRARAWIEVDGLPGFTDAGADLLEQIDVCGSLSEAARRLRFNYRRAWLLLDAMNTRWPGPLAVTATGGKKGGGSQLTELGRVVLDHYRGVQLELEAALDTSLGPLKLALRGTTPVSTARVRKRLSRNAGRLG